MTEEQRVNLRKLADYLDTLEPKRFNMGHFAEYQGRLLGAYEPETNLCGTVCCALGNGPRAGFPPLGNELWPEYAERIFGLPDGSRWEWCFSGQWEETDNTATGAAARIRWMLDNGLPRNWRNQLYGTARRLCYVKEITS